MKWCRFALNDKESFGIIEEDVVIGVDGSPFGEYAPSSQQHHLSEVTLLVPVIPPVFYAAGTNFRVHVTEMARRKGLEPVFPTAADIGYRANNALIADGENIVIPADAGELVQYEGELVVVIGKRCKRVTESEALDYVLGYTLGNDVSERAWQRGDRTFWRGKNSDTFKPMGPWIVSDLEPDSLNVSVRLNGEQVSRYSVGDALFSVRQFISRMSQYLTLSPGDVIWMGTDGATQNMKHGDVVEIECPEIGTLRNPVIRAT